jgi:hypothetical protein
MKKRCNESGEGSLNRGGSVLWQGIEGFRRVNYEEE